MHFFLKQCILYFQKVQQHDQWFGQCYYADKRHFLIWIDDILIDWRVYASPGLNECSVNTQIMMQASFLLFIAIQEY